MVVQNKLHDPYCRTPRDRKSASARKYPKSKLFLVRSRFPRTVYITLSHPPGPIIHGWYLQSWNSAGAKEVGGGNISLKSFPKTYGSVLALAPSWLSSNRAWKTGPRGCDKTPSSTVCIPPGGTVVLKRNMSRGNSLSDELRDLVRCLVLKLCQKIRLYGNLWWMNERTVDWRQLQKYPHVRQIR